MDSNDWTIYNGLMPAIEYDPVTQHIVFNAALLQLFNLPSSTSLPQFLEVITPLLWQQVCQLKHGQSKLIAWPAAALKPSRWLLWTAIHNPNVSANLFFQITDQTALGRTTSHWQQQSQLAIIGQATTGICHEVNQPLNAMRLRIYGLQAMLQGGGIDRIDTHLTELDNQVGRCAETLSNMREMLGHQSLNLTTFDAATSIDRIIQLLKHQFDLQQVNLINTHNHSNTHSKFLVFGQAQRLEQVLINLINNARDALLEQPPKDEPALISLGLALEDNQGIDGVKIEVTDNGPGIPLELQEKVFEAYYTSKGEHQGTGLGLAICKDLMCDLGGHLSLESSPGSTIFSLWLPAIGSQEPLRQ